MDTLDASERFVLGQLEGRELDDFLARLLFDPALQAEVAAARERIKAVRGLEAPPPAPPRARRWQWWAVVLVILAGALVYGWLRPVSPDPATAPLPQPPAVESPVAGAPAAHSDSGASKLPDTPPVARRLAADLRPNPALEYQLGAGQYRDAGAFQWTQAPVTEPRFARAGGKTRFSIEAAATASPDLARRLRWQVYSNQPADYDAGRASHSGPFSVGEQAGGQYVFSATADLALDPGLYYFLVEDPDTGDVFFVGKFVVR